jgi:hypothetical protein
VVEAAVAAMGGIEAVIQRNPTLFDYRQFPPWRSYRK